MSKVEDMRKEYSLSDLEKGVRGKYYDAYTQSHNIVLLNPEVAEAFPTDQAVNEALLSLVKLAKKSTGLTKQSIDSSNPETISASR